MSKQITNNTALLFCASIHHVRITIEPLPVALIETAVDGTILAVDRLTNEILQVPAGTSLIGRHISSLFEESADEIMKRIKEGELGLIGSFSLKRLNAAPQTVQVVMTAGVQLHRIGFNIIFGIIEES